MCFIVTEYIITRNDSNDLTLSEAEVINYYAYIVYFFVAKVQTQKKNPEEWIPKCWKVVTFMGFRGIFFAFHLLSFLESTGYTCVMWKKQIIKRKLKCAHTHIYPPGYRSCSEWRMNLERNYFKNSKQLIWKEKQAQSSHRAQPQASPHWPVDYDQTNKYSFMKQRKQKVPHADKEVVKMTLCVFT